LLFFFYTKERIIFNAKHYSYIFALFPQRFLIFYTFVFVQVNSSLDSIPHDSHKADVQCFTSIVVFSLLPISLPWIIKSLSSFRLNCLYDSPLVLDDHLDLSDSRRRRRRMKEHEYRANMIAATMIVIIHQAILNLFPKYDSSSRLDWLKLESLHLLLGVPRNSI